VNYIYNEFYKAKGFKPVLPLEEKIKKEEEAY